MIHKNLIVPVLCLLPVTTLAADINIRGFGSIVAGQTVGGDAPLYNYDDNLNFREESLFALQFDAELDDKLSATMQLISRGRESFAANVEWAYLTYEISEEFKLSAGRIRVPFYRYSDFTDVRYTYPWVKVPQTVYGFEFPGYDGLSLVHRKMLGSWDSSVQVIYGSMDGELPGVDLQIIVNELTGINWSLNRDWLTLRIGYFDSKVTLDSPEDDGLIQLINGIGLATATDLSSVVDGIVMENDGGNFLGLAAGIDHGNLLIDVEYIEYTLDDSLAADTDAFYIMGGYRFGRLMPYLTYSESDAKPDFSLLGEIPPVAAAVPVEQFGGATLSAIVGGAIAASDVDLKLVTAGVRYDFHKSAALKAELTEQSDGVGDDITLVRVGVDFVF